MNVIINATASRSSGALTILRQLLDAIPLYGVHNSYIVFVDPALEFEDQSNIKFIAKDTNKWKDRIKWDRRGIRKWIDSNGFVPDLIISLQNTAVNYPVRQIVYFHQYISLSDHKWNPFRREQLLLFLYRNVYGYFIKKYIRDDTEFITQLQCIKELLSSKYHIDKEKIHVIRPNISLSVGDIKQPEEQLDNSKIHFIYPATYFIYKNHKILIEAIRILKEEQPELAGNIRVHLTIDPDIDLEPVDMIRRTGTSSNFVLHSMIPYADLQYYYVNCRALLFPSFIETFGLPLIEAAAHGLPVVAADLPYSREVLSGYEGAVFVRYDSAKKWSDAIVEQCLIERKYLPLSAETENEWYKLFDLINTPNVHIQK